jgi:hypothetical protein
MPTTAGARSRLPQDAAGGDLHEPDLLPDCVDEEAVDRAEVMPIPVLDHPPPDVFVRGRHGAIEVLQFPEGGIRQCITALNGGVFGLHEHDLLDLAQLSVFSVLSERDRVMTFLHPDPVGAP